MAARWSALLLAGQLLLAAALTAALAAASTLRAPAIAVLAVVELGGVAWLLGVLPLILGRSRAPGGASAGRWSQLLRALCGDAFALEVALARMAAEPCRTPAGSAAVAGASGQRPVLLVHGFACSGAVWRPLLARLRAAGVGPARAVSLAAPFADIETYAAALLPQLEALSSGSGGQAVTVVTHSMGGLVARAALRRARPDLIGRIITLGAPHHGTALACCFPWPNARQMCLGSRWLTELNACQEGRFDIPVTTLYSLDDNYIVPAGSARLRGARTLELEGLGHLSLLDSKRVLGHVVSELLA